MTCGLKFKLCTSCLEICHMNKVSIKQNQYYTFVFTLESKHELFCVVINHTCIDQFYLNYFNAVYQFDFFNCYYAAGFISF